ncbi:DUF3530 family protein [Paraglaciecola mesophila]|nr:DUF3530 family protein [Paraglaciecola mesophila]
MASSFAYASALTDVQRQLFPDRAKILEVNNTSLPLIESLNTTANLYGVAILVGESGRPPASQQNLAMLTQSLNNLGWVTMQISPPTVGFEPDLADPTKSEEQSQEQTNDTASQVDQPANSQATSSAPSTPNSPQYQLHRISNAHFLLHEQALRERISAVMRRAQNYSGFRLVIAQGTSAAWMIKMYAEEQIPSPDAFVAISAFWPQRNLNALISTYTANTPMPLLDIYSDHDNNWGLISALERKNSANKNLKLDYRQRHLTHTFNTQSDSEFVSKEIYGWLHYLGW